MPDTDREQAAQGALLLRRLVPAPDHGRGFRRDPDTGFVYYSSEWLGDERPRVATQRCVICGRMIDPAVRYFTAAGQPRHMLCQTASNAPE